MRLEENKFYKLLADHTDVNNNILIPKGTWVKAEYENWNKEYMVCSYLFESYVIKKTLLGELES